MQIIQNIALRRSCILTEQSGLCWLPSLLYFRPRCTLLRRLSWHVAGFPEIRRYLIFLINRLVISRQNSYKFYKCENINLHSSQTITRPLITLQEWNAILGASVRQTISQWSQTCFLYIQHKKPNWLVCIF